MANDTVNITTSIAVYNMVLTGASSCLSILGAILIFLTHYWIPDIRKYRARWLLIYLTVADLLTALGNLVATVRYALIHGTHDVVSANCTQGAYHVTRMADICVGQSFVTTYSNMASFLWTLGIAVHIWSLVVLKSQKTEQFLVSVLYHVICWIVPLGIVIYMLCKDYLGEDYCFGTGVWCGIRSDLDKGQIEKLMYVADVAWQLFSYVTSCFLYIHVKFYRKLMLRGRLTQVTDHLRDEDKNFESVWLIIYLLKLWGLTRFFITTYATDHVLQDTHMKTFLKWLLLFQSYGASGQAFWNCILFCFLDKTVRTYLHGRFCCTRSSTSVDPERERLLRGSVQSND